MTFFTEKMFITWRLRKSSIGRFGKEHWELRVAVIEQGAVQQQVKALPTKVVSLEAATEQQQLSQTVGSLFYNFC